MRIASLFLLLLANVAYSSSLVPIEFSGGGGTPLTITILQDIEYTRTISGTDTDVAIVFTGAGFTTGSFTLNSPVNFLLNSTPATYNRLGSGYVSNDISLGDFYFFGSPTGVGLSQGDTIHLSAGSYSTSVSYSGGTPANGSYNSFIANTAGVNVATASAIPEPGSYVLILGLASAGCLILRRKIGSTKCFVPHP